MFSFIYIFLDQAAGLKTQSESDGMKVQEGIQEGITNTGRNLSWVSDDVRTGRGTHVHVTLESHLIN